MNKNQTISFLIEKFKDKDCFPKFDEFLSIIRKDTSPKAHQLLLSISIDLKFELVSIDDFCSLFHVINLIDVDNIYTRFADAVTTFTSKGKHTFSNHSSDNDEDVFSYASIMKTKWLTTLFPELGSIVTNRIRRPLNYTYTLYESGFSEYSIAKNNFKVWWLCDENLIKGIREYVDNPTKSIIDILGLEHLSKEGTEIGYYTIPSEAITAYQPNSTQGGWDSEYCPYLSYIKDDGWGRTFPVTGYNIYPLGGKERVIDEILINNNEDLKNSIRIVPIGACEMNIDYKNQNDLITEGIKRFER